MNRNAADIERVMLRVPRKALRAPYWLAGHLVGLQGDFCERKRPDPDVIHDARVAGRRFLAVVDLMEPLLLSPDPAIAEAVRRGTRALGRLRDADVLVELLAGLHSSHPAAVDHLRWRAARVRGALMSRAKRRVGVSMAALFHVLSEDAFVCPPAAAITQQSLGRVRARAGRVLRGCTAALMAATPSAPITQLHDCRLTAKRLRYTLEPLVGASARARRVMTECRALQEALGAICDRDNAATELLSRAEALESAASPAKRTLARDVRVLAEHMARVRDTLCGAFFEEWDTARVRAFRSAAASLIAQAFGCTG